MKVNSGLSRTLGTLVVPLATLALFLYTARKPMHVLEFPDPDFSFLFSSLGFLHGEPPLHVEYPGTPLQLLGIPVLLLRYLLLGTAPSLAEDFFLHPVAYQQSLLWVLFAILVGAQIFSARRLLSLGIPLSLACFTQLAPFFVWDGVVYLGHTSPEILLCAAGLALVPFLAEPARADLGLPSPARPIGVGVLLAVIVALKASSVPLIVLVLLLPAGRDRILAVGCFVTFLLGITAPAWPAFPKLFQTVVSQQSAAAERSFVTIATNASDPDFVLRAAPLLLAAWVLFILRFLQRREPSGQSTMPMILAGALLAFLVARSPASRHFLVLVPVISLAVIKICRHSGWQRAALLSITALGVMVAFPNRLAAQVAIRERSAAGLAALSSLLDGKYADCHVTVLEDAAIPAFTLYAGSRAVPRGLFAEELSHIYPRFTFRRGGSDTFRAYGRVLTDSAWAAQAFSRPCLVFAGKKVTAEDNFREAFRAEPILLDSVGEPPYLVVLGLSKVTEEKYRSLVFVQNKGRVPQRNSP